MEGFSTQGGDRVIRRTPLRPISARLRDRQRQYWGIRKVFLAEHWLCEFPGCQEGSKEVHHVRGRCGKLLLDTRHWKALCWRHHRWVHHNPVKGREMGLLNRLTDSSGVGAVS